MSYHLINNLSKKEKAENKIIRSLIIIETYYYLLYIYNIKKNYSDN